MAETTYLGIFWNVERFFDLTGGPVARSLGATAANNWNRQTYKAKLKNIAAVLSEAVEGREVGFLALAEVETNRVANDIVEELGWNDFVNPDDLDPNPDLDGNDVALLFSKKLFAPEAIQKVSVTLSNRFATRDLLYCRLKLVEGGDEVIMVVVHWPSRVISEGETLRTAHAFYLQRLIQQFIQFPRSDLINREGEIAMPPEDALKSRWNIPVIAVGDFNDEPYDRSVRYALRSYQDSKPVLRGSNLSRKDVEQIETYLNNTIKLFNPCWDLIGAGERPRGTYYRDASWRIYDQVLFSHGFLKPSSPLRYRHGSVEVFRKKEITYKGTAVEMATRSGLPRSFSLTEHTGASDHFPLLFEFTHVTQ